LRGKLADQVRSASTHLTPHHDYGLFLSGVGRLDSAAAEQLLKALPIRRHRQDQNLFWTLREFGEVLARSWRAKQAEPYLRESLSFYRALHWREDLRCTAQTAKMLATVCYQQGKLPETEKSYRESGVAYTKCNTVASADFTEVLRSLAEVLIVEQNLTEAESVLNEALAQERQILGERNLRTAAVLIALAR